MKLKIIVLSMLLTTKIVGFSQTISTVRIGNQTWMSKNMDIIISGSWKYNNEDENESKYGRLYIWEAAQKVCPSGFRLPSENDWQILIDYVGGEDLAAQKLKLGGQSGFNALMGGMSNIGNYWFINQYGTFWSSTNYDAEHAWYFYMTSKSNSVTKTYFNKKYGFSVRCIKK